VLSDSATTGATIDKSVAQSAHHEIAQTGPPASTPPETSDQPTTPPPVTSAPLVKAQDPTAAPTGADNGKRTEPTKSSGMLIISALILGIALLRIMWRVTSKYPAARKDQIFADHTWYNPYDDPEFCRQLRQDSALHPSWEREVAAMGSASAG
jgi:hypothetical protein